MKKILKKVWLVSSLYALISCGGGDSGGDTTPQVLPAKPVLEFPFRDELCTTGIFIENNRSQVEFLWKETANADSYTLTIKDQSTSNTEADIVVENIRTLKALVDIKQNNAYKWTVEAVSSSGSTSSDEWSMYNAAQGVQNYAPFPAELNAPDNNSIVATVTPTIQWQGNDVDNDIKEYEILLDTNTPPMASNGIEGSDISEKVLSGLSAGTKYYWQIVTTDEFGNSTKSEIREFTTP